jgi:hypothetical protein
MSSPTSKLFEKQFGKLIVDINKLVANTEASSKIDQLVKQYSLRHMLPTDMIISNFNTFIRIPYSDHISNKNADFFLKNDDFTVENSNHNNTITFLTSIFKEMWNNGLDEDTKDMIWMRLQILNKLCEKWI